MQKILVVAPNPWAYQEILARKEKYHFVFYESDFQNDEISLFNKIRLILGLNFEKEVHKLVQFSKENKIEAILAVDEFISSLIGAKAAEILGLPHYDLTLCLKLQHKYYSRQLQFETIPRYTPKFSLLNISGERDFPFFIKPIRGSASLLAYAVHDKDELRRATNVSLIKKWFLKRLLSQFESLTVKYANLKLTGNPWVKEELMSGQQVTVEGFVYRGENSIVGIVDSVMYPQSKISFERFNYPSRLPRNIQEEILQITREFISKIGFNFGFYNIEYFYHSQTNQISIIEINPRMAFQFSDLYEKVDGYNTFDTYIDLSLGKKPTIKFQQGKYAMATSFVLRHFEDAYVARTPSTHDVNKISEKFDARILIQACEKKKLSNDFFEDTESYRLMSVNIGAAKDDELNQKYQEICKELTFELISLKQQNFKKYLHAHYVKLLFLFY